MFAGRAVPPGRGLSGSDSNPAPPPAIKTGMRILLSEGASTSAREAITALGLAGHHVEVCDPDPHCLGRFSRFVRKFHRCPPLGADPKGYLAFILERISGGRFDVLLPIHEQGLLLAKAQAEIRRHAAIALPRFDSYLRAHNKLGFCEILDDLDLPQPTTQVVCGVSELTAAKRFPMVLKTPVGTASRGTWIVKDEAALQTAIAEIEAMRGFDDGLLMQDVVEGEPQQAQAVFADGELIASHAYRQVARGGGGGSAMKESVSHPIVRAHLGRIGEHLAWHGALSVDYVVEQGTGTPRYFDCNPRLVEPMSAVLAGVDLVDLLLRVSRDGTAASDADGRAGVRTHLALQALLGCAAREENRMAVLRECWRLFARREPYAGSKEELTPLASDWLSFVPATVTALWLMASPRAAHTLPKRGWGAQLLTPQTIRTIKAMDG
jgi:predicted ATP-grasp superfamily ATP-dependent carboligase